MSLTDNARSIVRMGEELRDHCKDFVYAVDMARPDEAIKEACQCQRLLDEIERECATSRKEIGILFDNPCLGIRKVYRTVINKVVGDDTSHRIASVNVVKTEERR